MASVGNQLQILNKFYCVVGIAFLTKYTQIKPNEVKDLIKKMCMRNRYACDTWIEEMKKLV